jgi:addiction module HigA family antidote
MKHLLDPIPPGEIIKEDYMDPLNLSQNQLARDLDVPVGRINQIIHGRRAITADTALRLARYFGTSPELWLGLQNDYDLRCAKRKLGNNLNRVHICQASHELSH